MLERGCNMWASLLWLRATGDSAALRWGGRARRGDREKEKEKEREKRKRDRERQRKREKD